MYTSKDHTFIICAYQESKYLNQAVLSIKKQTVQSNIIIITSTPNQYIRNISNKYNIPLYVNTGTAGIAEDWNFGYSMANTKIVTICHQDDYYENKYVELILERINQSKRPLIAFTDYGELRNGKKIYNNKLLNIKRCMLLPLKIRLFENVIGIRRFILSWGSPICCPSVTYVKENLTETIFQSGFQSDLDWQAWEKLSKLKGGFLYLSEKLVLHRIHEESATSQIIGNSLRKQEDYEMFCKFWPKCFAKKISKLYQKSEKSNDLQS